MVIETKDARLSLWLKSLIIILLFTLQGCGSDDHNKISVELSSNLTSEEMEVQKRFAEYIENNPDKAIDEYIKRFGNVVNTDNARELSTDYQPPNATKDEVNLARTKWSRATIAPSRALANAVYQKLLTENSKKEPSVVFTAGGASSGKSSSIASFSKLHQTLTNSQVIFDTTLSSEKTALANIKLALDAGKEVNIFYVYRNPNDAFTASLKRAMEIGRPVTINEFLDSHLNAPKVIKKISEIYPKISIYVVDNSGEVGKATSMELRDLIAVTNLLSRDKLVTDLNQLLDKSLSNGSISKDVYFAVKGID
jgi:hypothetical protein